MDTAKVSVEIVKPLKIFYFTRIIRKNVEISFDFKKYLSKINLDFSKSRKIYIITKYLKRNKNNKTANQESLNNHLIISPEAKLPRGDMRRL